MQSARSRDTTQSYHSVRIIVFSRWADTEGGLTLDNPFCHRSLRGHDVVPSVLRVRVLPIGMDIDWLVIASQGYRLARVRSKGLKHEDVKMIILVAHGIGTLVLNRRTPFTNK